MNARPVRFVVRCLAALGWVAASLVCQAAAEPSDDAQPAAPPALSCGGDIIPILKAVDDLQREHAVLARQGDSMALRVVEAKLASAEAVRLFAFSRYAGSDPAEALAAMRAAVARAEALPRAHGAALVAAARSTLTEMMAASHTMRFAGSVPVQP